jgi:CheY-like chemotaxis protein
MIDRSVLIVDDNAEFRRLTRQLLESGGYSVVGEADDAGGALRAHAALRPEIVLLDIQLPDQDGFAVAESLAAEADPQLWY